MDPSRVNYLGAIVAALATFVIGGLWYSPLLFQRAWLQGSGLREEDLRRGGAARVFGPALLLSLVSSVNLAFFLADGRPSLAWGVCAGLLAGLGWVATSLGVTYLFERRPLRLYLIDAGYHVLAFAVMGAILGVWKK